MRGVMSGQSRWALGVGLALGMAGAAEPGGGGLEADPMCVTTNLVVDGAFSEGEVEQPEGTRRMVELLQRHYEAIDPMATTFFNDRRVEALRGEVAGAKEVREEMPLRFRLARELVNAGRPEEGLAEFARVEALLDQGRLRLAAAGRAEFRMRHAVAWLRLGEQENCVDHHQAESCLLPIRGDGVHQRTRGSRGALPLLREQLRAFPDDLGARWLMNVAYMTLGEWPERVPSEWVIPAAAFASEHPIRRFPNVAGALGLDVNDLAGGVVLDDFDNDGLIDVVVSAWGSDGPLRYFRNEGDGRFTERTREAGLAGLVGALNIQQTDFNNDGHLDIWMLRGAWLGEAGRIPNSLLRNNGDGTFTDVTEEAGLLSRHPTQASVWFDFDGDGWLDVFIGNESWNPRDPDRCELYRNNGDGTFTEVAAESGLAVARLVKGVAVGDIDNDGRPDLYLSCRDSQRNLLFRNEGPAGTNEAGRVTWRFTEVGERVGVSDSVPSFPTWFFDFDNDGHEDLFVSGYAIEGVGDVAAEYLGLPNRAARPRLYRNRGDGTFVDVTMAVGLDRVCLSMGANFGDLDNDGWLDMYLGTGDPDLATIIPNRMFRNDGGRRFQDVSEGGGFGHLQKGHGIAFADLDHDGHQDVYLVAGGAYTGDNYPNALFLNPGNSNRWIALKLEGTRSNRAAIGARLRVRVQTPDGSRTIHRTVSSGGSFGSSPLRQHVGLGDAVAVTGIEVDWPASGIRQVLVGLEMERGYRIREGEAEAAPMALPRIDLGWVRRGAGY
ncbi:MAG: CRTAC1 family protein [Verrucomicrobiae bacterium]|nr:CRTAC1 family protein [Verrucomicrobiae bacterium]